MQLTDEQRNTIHELQKELREMNLQADIAWAKYMHTGDEECFEEAQGLDSEIEMKGLISYIPKAGEHKISKVRKLLAKVQGKEGEDCDGCDLGKDEARLGALESVNAWREEYNLPPLDRLPRGVPGDASECTLAMAFRISLQEMGLENISVEVNHHDSISLRGYGKDGWEYYRQPTLSKVATDLISGFDEDAWLDLLTDDSLERYAQQKGGADDPEDVDLDRLQDISEEFAAREMTYPMDVWGYGPDESLTSMGVILGRDQEAVREQVKLKLAG